MAVGMAVSIALFCDQTKYVGWVPAITAVGDLTFEVGFVLSAPGYYILHATVCRSRRKVVALPD